MILYHGEPNGASLTVLAALEESGLAIACQPIDLLAGARHRIAGLTDRVALDMGVEGEGPVLVIDGEAMTESVFIAQFFDELAGGAGLQPNDPYTHWQMMMWCRRVTERASPAAAFLGSCAYSHGTLAARSDADFGALAATIASTDLKQRWQDLRDGHFPTEQVTDSQAKVIAFAQTAEDQLADGRDWLIGHFTIADLVSFSWLAGMRDLVPELTQEKPRIQAWFARMEARPSIQRALARATTAKPLRSWAPGPEINRWG
ncbi:MAG: glutathione S-transferase family protein [Novosphingobium sp.]